MLFADSEGGPLWAFISLMIACWFFSRAAKLWRNPDALKQEREERAQKRQQSAANIAGTLLKAYFNHRR